MERPIAQISSRIAETAGALRRQAQLFYQWSQPHAAAAYAQCRKVIAERHAAARKRASEVLPSNAQFIGTRDRQEDAVACSDFSDDTFITHGGYFAVLADGMGGYAAGTEASRGAVQAMLTAYVAKTAEEPIGQALRRALNAAHTKLRARKLNDESGTTVVAVVWHNSALQWISVGDSRAYVLRDNKLIQVTKDHNYAAKLEEEVRENRMRATLARQHPEREYLTSYVGGAEIAEIDCSKEPFTLEPDDRVILCSDGVYRSLTEEELIQNLGASVRSNADAIIDAIKRKAFPEQDNASAIVLRLPQSGFSTKRFLRLLTRPQLLFWTVLALLIAFIWSASR